ncbi:hypothetical protein TrLO_g1227 [Triparma laevis f. longispina]|uniref:CCHC-type domain-containing protein n=1 Tax=Triparma laevis f. longispina TaxID=1714387 RepID=A0A9W7EI04_9STRA|nr:hypothetical protein TrLO_g1227 [Triparma laevis f. longispina]
MTWILHSKNTPPRHASHDQEERSSRLLEENDGDQVLITNPSVVIVPETDNFRYLASYVSSFPNVIELGPSTGETTNIILNNPATRNYVGCEVGKDMLKILNSKFISDPIQTNSQLQQVRFKEINTVDNPHLLVQVFNLLKEGAPERAKPILPSSLAFVVDIGGSEPANKLLPLIFQITKKVSPGLILVKCRELYWQLSGLDGEISPPTPPQKHNKRLHPLKQPLRLCPTSGIAICRFWNYNDDCKKENCEFVHDVCHFCGQQGHRARECI